MDNQLLAPVITVLKNDGASDDAIADILSDITTAATVMLYSKAMDVLSDDDLKAIEDSPTDEKAYELMAHLYAVKVGVSPQELMNRFLSEYVTKFMQGKNN